MDSRKDLTKLLELIQKWNDISSVVVVVACVWAVLRSNITSRWSVNHTASEAAFEDSQRYFEWACTVAGTGAVIEGTYLLSSSGRENSVTGTHSALDSKVMLLIYVSLSFFYMAMSLTGMVLVHSDELAVGGPRPVYTLRFVQWCACVPLLMLVGGRHQPAPSEVEKVLSELLLHPVQSKPRPPSWQDALEGLQEFPTTLKKALWDAPLAASVRLTVIYMIAAWLALVVDDDLSRWVLICVAFSAYFVASLQQLAMLVVMKNEQGHCICAWLMALQVLIFAGHGTVYLCACFNLISSPREQKLFACLDIFAKLGHTMVLLTSRRRADYLEECCLRNSAINAASDLQRMIQEANVPIFTVNNNLEVDGWNLKIAELTGRSPDTANIALNELIADGDDYLWKSAAIELINDALAGRVTHTAQVHFIKSEDGKEETVTVAVSATPLRSPNGEVRGAVCVGQDVTELTSQRQEAQTLAASLSNLIDMAAAPIFQVGMDCCITEWNRWLVEASGLSKMQVLGERLISVICASCRLNVTKMVKLSLEHKRTEVFEITLETANVTLLVNATTLVDSSGNPTGAICIGQDITKLKDIDDWKSSMMAMVSHELKSPLHGIIGLSHSLLEDESTTSGAKKPLAMINSSAMRLLDIVSNMMDASRLARQPLIGITKDPVQLASIIEEVVLLCQQAVDKRGVPTLRHGVKLINSVNKTLPVIEADAYRCTQLMFNLISNAIKFTNQGSVTISASADDVEQMVTVDVKDTGIGISPENIDTIFQPFDQEDRSEQRKYEGLGLGLAICREVVQKHGGNLTVKSLKGKGSTFRVTLPYKVRDYQDENDASTVAGDNGTGACACLAVSKSLEFE
ncbi:unnamed protein product [Effrenium voratum]|uniref:histidine kinase n=1 Tax=Effrenium voratum TaxID=2562239 RepID=A0AA36MZI2_9DINO|nr:unnamed protein product [Effrenium voratum]